jgi:GT2 family glycosyltransferase
MMRRKAFENYGPFDERFGIWSDVDLWLRLAEDFDVCYVDEPLIAIINRKLAPHQFEDSSSRVQRLTEAMFWEARMRHFRDRPLRRIGEAIRHFGFALAARSFNTAIQVKHRLTV